jgi:hypothetical protein
MNFLEYKSNAWGQRVLEGVSWDVIWLFVAIGVAVIAIHSIYVVWRRKVAAKTAGKILPAENIDE